MRTVGMMVVGLVVCGCGDGADQGDVASTLEVDTVSVGADDASALDVDAARPCVPGSACDDGNACTLSDRCDDAGVCAGDTILCPPATNQCRKSLCNPATGACVETSNDGASCDDGDGCTDHDRCSGDHCAGESIVCPCPSAVITCFGGDTFALGADIHCSAASSTGDGQITDYLWSLTRTSGASVVHREGEREFLFIPDAEGTYTLTLDVVDAHGTHACESAARTFEVARVVDPEGLFIDVAWRTPGDPDETDSGFTLGGNSVGSDLDLHLLHPDASAYFDSTFDVYWLNKAPNWGGSGALDDPLMLRDDTDGAGPEQLSLHQPQTNKTYRVGVHYWDDWGFGDAFVTVRVYVGGVLTYTSTETELWHQDMWDVCDITWSGGVVTPVAPTPSIRHNYPIPF